MVIINQYLQKMKQISKVMTVQKKMMILIKINYQWTQKNKKIKKATQILRKKLQKVDLCQKKKNNFTKMEQRFFIIYFLKNLVKIY